MREVSEAGVHGEDGFLCYLVEGVDRAPAESSYRPRITLLIGGAVVSGRVISAREYFSAARIDESTKNALHAYYGAENADRGPPAFLHLAGAEIHQSDATRPPIKVGSDQIFLRVRLTAVDGFFMAATGLQETPK